MSEEAAASLQERKHSLHEQKLSQHQQHSYSMPREQHPHHHEQHQVRERQDPPHHQHHHSFPVSNIRISLGPLRSQHNAPPPHFQWYEDGSVYNPYSNSPEFNHPHHNDQVLQPTYSCPPASYPVNNPNYMPHGQHAEFNYDYSSYSLPRSASVSQIAPTMIIDAHHQMNPQAPPLGMKPKVTTTLWEDEGTLCFQVESKGICVARREDNDMINGTKLLNVAGMTRGRRDGILKSEKDRYVVKIGAMHLKGVWIPFSRALDFANREKITDLLYPLFVEDIKTFLYHPTNYARTTAVMAAANQRRQGMHFPPPLHSHQGRPGIERSLSFPTPPSSASSILSLNNADASYWAASAAAAQAPATITMEQSIVRAASVPGTPAATPPDGILQNLQQYPLSSFSEPSSQHDHFRLMKGGIHRTTSIGEMRPPATQPRSGGDLIEDGEESAANPSSRGLDDDAVGDLDENSRRNVGSRGSGDARLAVSRVSLKPESREGSSCPNEVEDDAMYARGMAIADQAAVTARAAAIGDRMRQDLMYYGGSRAPRIQVQRSNSKIKSEVSPELGDSPRSSPDSTPPAVVQPETPATAPRSSAHGQLHETPSFVAMARRIDTPVTTPTRTQLAPAWMPADDFMTPNNFRSHPQHEPSQQDLRLRNPVGETPPTRSLYQIIGEQNALDNTAGYLADEDLRRNAANMYSQGLGLSMPEYNNMVDGLASSATMPNLSRASGDGDSRPSSRDATQSGQELGPHAGGVHALKRRRTIREAPESLGDATRWSCGN